MTEEEMTEEEKETMAMLINDIASELEGGKKVEDIAKELMDQGVPEKDAKDLVAAVEAEIDNIRGMQEVVNVVAERLLMGEDADVIVAEMVAQGVDREEAKRFVEGIKADVDQVLEEERHIEEVISSGIANGLDQEAILNTLEGEGYDKEDMRPLVADMFKNMKP